MFKVAVLTFTVIAVAKIFEQGIRIHRLESVISTLTEDVDKLIENA